MKKIEKGIKFVSEHLDMFRCTVDSEPMTTLKATAWFVRITTAWTLTRRVPLFLEPRC